MTAFLTVVRLELVRRLREPVALLVWLAIPFALIGILVVVFGGHGEAGIPRIPVLVVDHDGGIAGRLLAGALASPALAEILDSRTVTPEEAERRMASGEASLVIEIPEGVSRSLADGEPVTLHVRRNPAETVLPAVAEDVVRILARDGELLRALIRPLLAGTGDGGDGTFPSAGDFQRVAERLHALLSDERTSHLLSLDSLAVKRKVPAGRSRSEIVGWFAPGFVALSLLFLASGQSQEIQEDLLAGRLRRALSWPRPAAFTVAAKGCAIVLSVWATATLLELLLAAVLGWRPGPAVPVALHTLATAAAFSGLALLLRSMTRNPEAGGAAASGILVGLGFLGGCFIPTPLLPAFIRETARWIPTGWAVDGFIALQGSAWAGDVGSPAAHSAALAACGVACFFVAARLLARRVVGT